MKKSEKKLQTIREMTSDWLGKVVVIMGIVITLLTGILGIIMAKELHNYLLLSVIAYMVVTLLMYYTKRVFFERLNHRMLKKQKLAEIVFGILAVVTILLSCKYFIAFILTFVIAIMRVDFLKVVEVEE